MCTNYKQTIAVFATVLVMQIGSWTDFGMTWGTLHEKPLYPYAEALRTAALERAFGVKKLYDGGGASTISIPAVLANPLQSGQLTRADWQSAFDDLIDDLIPLYANYTLATSGEFAGLTSAPVWTEAALLADIGDPQRYRSQGAEYLHQAEWAKQQYEILQRMKWGHLNDVFARQTTGTTNTTQDSRTGTGVSFAAATTSWNAASWTSQPSPAAAAAHDAEEASGYTIRRFRFTDLFGPFDATYAKELDYYLKMETNIDTPSDPTPTYENNDYPAALNEYQRFHSIAAATTDNYTLSFGDISTVTVTDPGASNFAGWAASVGASFAILKFDVTGGFNFI